MKRFKLIKQCAVALLCMGLLPFVSQAVSLTVGDAFTLGTINPGSPSSAADEAGYINTLIGLALNGSTTIPRPPAGPANDNVVVRSNNAFASLPTASAVGSVRDETGENEGDFGSGFQYLVAKYGPNTVVWFVGGLTGEFEVPEEAVVGSATRRLGLSHTTLITPGGGGSGVPDGGSTFALMGMVLSSFAFLRRKLS
jgi:hypothetical protein